MANFNKSLLAALRPRGKKWLSYAIMMALCVPGHALDLAAITQREVFTALRRQAARDHGLARLIADLRYSAQAVHGGGPVARLFQTLHQLDWRWTDTGTLLDDLGTKISWLNIPPGCFGHILRCSQRRSLIRRIPKTRHDLGFLSTLRQGIDTFACAWLMRTKGTMKLTKCKLGLLIRHRACTAGRVRMLVWWFCCFFIVSRDPPPPAPHASLEHRPPEFPSPALFSASRRPRWLPRRLLRRPS